MNQKLNLRFCTLGIVFLMQTGWATMSYLTNSWVTVGIDLAKGGSITYLAQTGTTNNIINSEDLGREVQQSYYADPALYNPSNNINPGWSNWCWNPIQTGDSYGHASQILSNSNNGTTIYVKCIPKQWALNNVPGQCTFESWITLTTNVVIVSNRLVNMRTDSYTNPFNAHSQELPAVYTVGTLYNLYSYVGNAPFTGDVALANFVNSGPPWTNWSATESWAAFLNTTNWGLGIYTPGAVSFIGGFAGTPGSGGPSSPNTGYIAPLYSEILDPNITYTYNYQLILGSLTDIRNWVYTQSYRPGLNSVFQADRQHWYFNNTTDVGWPLTNNCIRMNLAAASPRLISSTCAFFATNAPTVYITAAHHIANPAGHTSATLYWLTNGGSSFTAGASVTFPITADGLYHTYALNPATNSAYAGLITKLRLDPAVNCATGDYVDVAAVSSMPLPLINSSVTGLTTNQATLNATLDCIGTNASVYAYWNTVNGGTNAARWTNSTYLGSWTNVLSTNLSYTVTGLTPNTTYYFTFYGTNAAGNQWPAAVQSFTTPQPPTQLVFTSVPTNPLIAGQPFSVTVTSADAGGSPQNVTNNTTVQLGVFSGSGILSGTTSGTIATGSSSVVIAGGRLFGGGYADVERHGYFRNKPDGSH